jgi:hypothetical protein
MYLNSRGSYGLGDTTTDLLGSLTDSTSFGASPLMLAGVGLLLTAIVLSYGGKARKRYVRRKRIAKRKQLVSQLTAL